MWMLLTALLAFNIVLYYRMVRERQRLQDLLLEVNDSLVYVYLHPKAGHAVPLDLVSDETMNMREQAPWN